MRFVIMRLLSESLLTSLITTCTFLSTARSHPSSQNPVIFETHRAPSTFTRLPLPVPINHTLDLRIGLKTRLEHSIEELLSKISDPFHPSYREYLTDPQSDQLVKPEDDAIDAVSNWLKLHGFREDRLRWSRNKDWVTLINVPLSKVEELLDTDYYIFKHRDGEHVVRTEQFSLPHYLHRHIDVVQPTTMFGRLNQQRTTIAVVDNLPPNQKTSLPDLHLLNQCSNPRAVTNTCLRKLYKTLNYKPKWYKKGNMIATTGYLKESTNFKDLELFLKTQRLDQVGQNVSIVSVNGGKNPQSIDDDAIGGIGIEASLDTQTVLGFTAPTPNIFYTVGGSPPFTPDGFTSSNTNEPYLEWLEYILALKNSEIPQVISTSYGDDEQTVPFSYAKKVCNAFGQLGARGVSVIFSSGDHGVGPTDYCNTNDENHTYGFLPTFPASCPYVTAVGGTEGFNPEVAVSNNGPGGYTSGGGFSNYFSRPSWQNSDVKKYLRSIGKTYQGLYNTTGRGFPDVSAQGAKYVIAYRGDFIRVGGTSAAAPTFASVISLLNDYSFSRGGKSLGYLNPWLYAHGRKGLNDIVSGSSSGCNKTGFAAQRGWDPVTGLGTPEFLKLKRAVVPPYSGPKQTNRA